MNPKLLNKKLIKRTPLRTSFVQNNKIISNPPSTSRGCAVAGSSSLYAAISNKPVSVEEHNKVMIQNQKLAKENAYLKSQLQNYKESLRLNSNEKIELKQQLIVANERIQKFKSEMKNKKVPQKSLVSDQFKTAVNLLMEDYLAIDCIRNQMTEFGGRVETVKGIMTSLQSLIDSDNQFNESESLELSSDRLDSFRSSNNSIRLSLSSQEIQIKRRLSTERIRRDFQILSELSTILETTEQRTSSFENNASDSSNVHNKNRPEIVVLSDESMGTDNIESTAASISTTIVNEKVTTTTNKNKSKVAEKSKPTKTKSKKEVKPKNTTKAETKPKKTTQKQTKNKSEAKSSVDSIYDFIEDEENKENVAPINVNPPQRHSKRIRSKRFSLH